MSKKSNRFSPKRVNALFAWCESTVYGHFGANDPLRIRSRMSNNGVTFSGGVKADYLRFTAGMEIVVSVSSVMGLLVN